MKLNPIQFLNPEPLFCEKESAAVAILPVPYEGGTSYGKGAARAPLSVIESSHFLELFDEELKAEPFRMGIMTALPPKLPENPSEVENAVYESARTLMEMGKYVVLLGGDHSISVGYFKALLASYGRLSVIQFDAHADLRESYDGSPFSHACVMSRLRELTGDTLQIGIRSMSVKEAERIKKENLPVHTMQECRNNREKLMASIEGLPDPVFVTLDVDVFDWSVIRSTGTPEPGGFEWYEGLDLIKHIFYKKNVVGFDVVELSYEENDRNSPFATAKLIYKMLGFKLASKIGNELNEWPKRPIGSIFDQP
jgi:agmatinase